MARTLAQQLADQEARIAALEKWQEQIKGALRLAASFNGVLIGVLVYLIINGLK